MCTFYALENSNSFSMYTFYTLDLLKGRGGCRYIGFFLFIYLFREKFLGERFLLGLRNTHTTL